VFSEISKLEKIRLELLVSKMNAESNEGLEENAHLVHEIKELLKQNDNLRQSLATSKHLQAKQF